MRIICQRVYHARTHHQQHHHHELRRHYAQRLLVWWMLFVGIARRSETSDAVKGQNHIYISYVFSCLNTTTKPTTHLSAFLFLDCIYDSKSSQFEYDTQNKNLSFQEQEKTRFIPTTVIAARGVETTYTYLATFNPRKKFAMS